MIFNSVFLCLWCLRPRLIPVLVGIPLCVCLCLCFCLSTLSSHLYLYPCVSLSPCPCLCPPLSPPVVFHSPSFYQTVTLVAVRQSERRERGLPPTLPTHSRDDFRYETDSRHLCSSENSLTVYERTLPVLPVQYSTTTRPITFFQIY